MTVLTLVTPEAPVETVDKTKLARTLEVLDILRADLESGRLKAFAAVGIASDHTTFRYQAFAAHTTRLELLGACQTLLHANQTEGEG